MRPGLIVKGRRYWDDTDGGRRYVTALKSTGRGKWLVEWAGVVYTVKPYDLLYLSAEDAEMCQRLAESAKMAWFNYDVDPKDNFEYNREYDDSGHLRRTSFRHAVKALSEGLIDLDFERMRDPHGVEAKFRRAVMGMGYSDPGPYFRPDDVDITRWMAHENYRLPSPAVNWVRSINTLEGKAKARKKEKQ